MKKPYSARLFLAAAALSFGLAASAQAMPRGEHPGPGMGMPGHHAMVHGRAVNRLHDELKLDAKQEAQWKEAEKFSQDPSGNCRAPTSWWRPASRAVAPSPASSR